MEKIDEYRKNIPPFYRELLDQLNKFRVFSLVNEVAPHQYVHYRPYKTGIEIHTSSVIKLSHELAHMLEVRDDQRLLQLDYGIKKYFPTTSAGQLKAIAREARVRGIQTRLVSIAFGNCRMLYHRLANIVVKPAGVIGKFKNEQEVLDWSCTITRGAYNSWCADKIAEVWRQKAAYINEWLETKHSSTQEHSRQQQTYDGNVSWRFA